MQKTEAQRRRAQHESASKRGGGASFEPPQGGRLAQLEAIANGAASVQGELVKKIHNTPSMIKQRMVSERLQERDQNITQRQFNGGIGVAQREEISGSSNGNGARLPDNLKHGIESLSGISMDSVKVHYNSTQPAQLNALAYAQGSDIHVAPVQEQHLPHEAWHVVQQAQGRVKPTMQMKGNLPVNDDKSLEHEADAMGSKALKAGRDRATGHLEGLRVTNTIQKKNRIDLSKVEDDKREKIRTELEILKQEKRRQKKEATKVWASSSGKDHNRDATYNTKIEEIRREYEKAVKDLADEHNVTDTALISKEAYYGEEVDEGGVKFHRRADTGKEYVKDMRGTFVPRYIRRELNHQDRLDTGITTQGISTLDDLKASKDTGPGGAAPLSWEQREFLQQSIGGGNNLFALSHSSTKRPILSNDHKSFGEKPDRFAHSGAIITDLAKMGNKKFAAQWTIDQITGHKVPLPEGVHKTLDWKNKADSGKERDETVRMSGYRNMEVVAEGVPKEAILQPDVSWKTAEGPKSDYHTGESRRGKDMQDFRAQKQEEVMGRLYWQEVEARYIKAQRKKPKENQIPLADAIKIDDDRGRHWKGELEKSSYWKGKV